MQRASTLITPLITQRPLGYTFNSNICSNKDAPGTNAPLRRLARARIARCTMEPSRVDAAMQTYRMLTRTARALRRSVNATLKEHGLTGAQFSLLTSIPSEGIPLTQLANRSWADPGNVSGTIDRLESSGWVTRERSADDRRVVLVFLSDRGKELLAALVPRHREAVDRALSGLSLEQMEQLRTLLAILQPPAQG